MKIAPIMRALDKHENVQTVLVHTGQHYDESMSKTFFTSLGIPTPDYYLDVGSGSHAEQTAAIMVEFEKVCLKELLDIVVVVGDVNSTIAAGLVAKKLRITLVHVEAGLRSRDRSMPEEINRIATDAISDIYFTTEEDGTANLLAEGKNLSTIHFVGNVMIDNLLYQLRKIRGEAPSENMAKLKSIVGDKYICATMHRPSNVDDEETLTRLIGALCQLADQVPVVFPCHPRTLQRLDEFGLISLFQTVSSIKHNEINRGMILTEPLSYDDFLYLWKDCAVVLTDSGGLQEETTALGVPCITMRENTERPITVVIGTNVVVGTDQEKIVFYAKQALEEKWKQGSIPDLWDGKASERIVDILKTVINNSQL